MTDVRMAVVGAGMQGTAAGYDLARFGATEVRMLDLDGAQARAAAQRINQLVGRTLATGAALDARDEAALARALAGVQVVLSGAPYRLNEALARGALAARASFGDLGGNTDVVWRELGLDAEARAAGVSIVPDLGLAPGMANTLAVWAMSRVEGPRHVRAYCGGLPEVPRPPLGYQVVFSVEGLANEYTGKAVVVRDGVRCEVETLAEQEELDFPGLGRLEACTTSGGASTCPWTFAGKIESYAYKTLRYPGHFEKIRLLRDLGLLDLAAIEVGGQRVVPREVFHALARRRLSFPGDRDLIVLRVECEGRHERVQYDLLDRFDEATGFTAMERTTAFPASIVCLMMARGELPPGAVPLEQAVPAGRFLEELQRRGLQVTERRVAL